MVAVSRVRLAALAALSLLAACGSPPPPAPPSAVQPPPAATVAVVDEQDLPLPLDARIKQGKLANGLTYYVLPHQKPEKRAQIWLAVNAGSVLEDDDQRGLAHFVEHMGFNGTRRFPKQELVDFLEKSGVRFGADLNAYTSNDETVYTLQVPTDKPELVNKAVSILRDWADGVTFDPQEVEKERGVVLEEWRLGRGARMRILDKQAPVLFHGSKYAERITIGKPEIIRGASRDTLMRFYKDWYRPDLMAVVAVGDFSGPELEARIKSEFGTLPTAVKPRPRVAVPMPPHEQPRVTIETDPEMPFSSVGMITKLPHRQEKTTRDYRRSIAERLFNTMMSSRLDELRRLPDAPFIGATSGAGRFVRPIDAFSQSAVVKEGGVERGFSALLEEVLRVERHGFKATELERARSQVLRGFQQAVKERDKMDARGFAQEIVRNFLIDEAMPGPERELQIAEKLLPGYTLAEINAVAKAWSGGSQVLFVTGPAQMVKPTEEALLAMRKGVEGHDIKPYEDAAPTEPLMASAPTPGPVVKSETVPEVGITVWTLKNGVRVVVKPTTFKNDEVRMTAFSPGGHSRVPDVDFDSARLADSVVAQGGLGPYDAVKLRKSLAGKVASVSAHIGELDEHVTGMAAPSDLEVMLQMAHLSFTAPRRDEGAFTSWRAREVESVRNRRLSPEVTFAEDLQLFLNQDHLRRRPLTPEVLQKVSLDKAMEVYKDRFADAGDFTFVFVGNLDLEKLKPLVETYLGSLPSKGRKETWRDVKITRPRGVQTKTVSKGSEPKSSVQIVFTGTEKWTRDTENDMRMLGEVLRMRLREVLREDMSGVYGVGASGRIARRPRPEYMFTVSFGCSPDNIEKLQKAVFDEVKGIQEKGIDDAYLSKVKEMRRRAHETDLKDNGFWLRELETAYTFGDDPKNIPDIAGMSDKVTSDRVRAAARKYISDKQYVLGVLKPEVAPPTAAAR